MISSLFASVLLGSQEALKQSYVFPGMPMLTVPADVARPVVVWHSVTITLSATTAKIEATTLYKNPGSSATVS